eukprot:2221-Heterococcus_DN1.PRE.2
MYSIAITATTAAVADKHACEMKISTNTVEQGVTRKSELCTQYKHTVNSMSAFRTPMTTNCYDDIVQYPNEFDLVNNLYTCMSVIVKRRCKTSFYERSAVSACILCSVTSITYCCACRSGP